MVNRGMRLHGLLDLLFAALYAIIAFWIAPGRGLLFPLGVAAICVLLSAAGVGLLLRARWGQTVATIACWALLVGCALVMGGLALSSVYLRTVYGGFGKGVAMVCLLFAAVVFQLAGLLPIFQLRFLRRCRAVRASNPSQRRETATAGEP